MHTVKDTKKYNKKEYSSDFDQAGGICDPHSQNKGKGRDTHAYRACTIENHSFG